MIKKRKKEEALAMYIEGEKLPTISKQTGVSWATINLWRTKHNWVSLKEESERIGRETVVEKSTEYIPELVEQVKEISDLSLKELKGRLKNQAKTRKQLSKVREEYVKLLAVKPTDDQKAGRKTKIKELAGVMRNMSNDLFDNRELIALKAQSDNLIPKESHTIIEKKSTDVNISAIVKELINASGDR